jgi:GAF domain-containing protein
MSATPESTLANPEQRIADLERQLAECKAELDKAQWNLNGATSERDEALAQQTATAEVLQVINSSPGDLAPVFDVILKKAHALCGSSHGALFLCDGERFMPAAMSAPELLATPLRQGGMGSDAPLVRPMLAGEPFVHIVDLRLVDHPLARAAVAAGVRTLLSVPLRKGGTLIGMINAARFEVHPFSEKQIALLQNFAVQAVIAMENARLITETQEALEQQTATAEVLGVINSSPGYLAPVFDAMLERATRLCDASFGVLRTWDGECFHVRAVHGEPRFSDWVREREPARPEGDDPLARIAKGAGVVHFADASDDPAYLTSPAFKDAVELSGMRSGITVPLRKDDALRGAITLYRQEVRPFTDKQIALLQNFAAQAVIAMENARLLTETREALEQQTATAEVLRVINSSPGDLTPVFDAILEKAHTLCGAAHGNLWIYDGEFFHPVATRGNPRYAEWLRDHSFVPPTPGTVLERIVRGEDFLHIADAASDQAFCTSAYSREVIEVTGARTTLIISLRKDTALLGVIFAYRQEVRPFSEKQIALFKNFAAQAVIAMENVRLLTETREALEQQTATAEVLQVINSSPGDLAPVFDTMLDKAMHLCEAAFGALATLEGEYFRAVASRGMPAGLAENLRRPFTVPPGSTFDELAAGVPVVQIPDVAADDRPAGDTRRALIELGGARTGLAVALRKDDKFLGALWFYRQEVRPFSDKQIALLQNFAAQAVIAMENARLIGELHERNDQVAELNRSLEARVAEQVEELGRVGRLKRFLAPQLAELIVSQGDEKILESHRREIVVVFCDLRGYTAFTETAEPEEVLDFLREYHGALGPLVAEYEGTLDQFSGDGIMVFFNDPVPCPDPAERSVKMAMAMREAAGTLIAGWRRRGRLLGFGAGIDQGYATLGQIGFAERSGYTAIGTVCNLAARLCAEAQDGQILIGQRVAVAVEETITLEEVGALTLKGLTQPVVAYNVPLAPIQPALRVIEGGPQSV